MARLVTQAHLRQEALRRVDQEQAGYFTNAEVNTYLNQSICEWYEVQIGYGEELYLASSPIILTAPITGTNDTYLLPSDFFRVRGVDAVIQGGTFDLVPFNFLDRNLYKQFPTWTLGALAAYRVRGASTAQGPTNGQKYMTFIPAPGGATSANLWYYPNPPQLNGDTDSVDGSAGWEEFIILHTAAKMLTKQGRDNGAVLALAGAEMQRIQSSAQKVDAAHPEVMSVTRVWGARNRRRLW